LKSELFSGETQIADGGDEASGIAGNGDIISFF